MTENVCTRCKKCAESCPLGAISKTETEEIEICGKKMTVAKINYDLCKICKNGALKNRFSDKAKPDRVAALCNRTCMDCLRVENKFENKFRTSDVWSIGGINVSTDKSEAANVLGGEFSKTGNRGNQK